ncbi:MAG: ATP-binding protein [Burkholderiales bacterium]
MKQVFVNLLSNAIKYNRAGGSVEVSCSAGASRRTRINFRDSGNGLSADNLSQLFQPFNRLGQESGAEEGTGIGLVVSKRLVELMGGEIGAESAVGVGSVFWVELESASALDTPIQTGDNTEPPLAAAGAEPASLTVLCIEDNPANLMLIEKLVARRPDIRMLSARDGNQGVAVARASLPDAILMDINLPGIGGLMALRILADDPKTASIPVIALSANAMPRDIEKGLAAGFFRYLTKPIKVVEFMDALDVALKFSQPRSSHPIREGPT